MTAGLQALDQVPDWRHYYQTYMGRNYFRVEEPAAGCGPSANAVAANPLPPAGP
jgi:hypothetical protein